MNFYDKSIDETLNILNTNKDAGLDLHDVDERLKKYGENKLKEKKKKSIFKRFIDQLKDFALIILIIAAIISGIISFNAKEPYTDSIVIGIVIIINCIIGVSQELKAEKSLDALKNLTKHSAKVIRDGKLEIIDSSNLVPGDIIVLEAGDYVPSDGRIIESSNFQTQESQLTGESLPVNKNNKVLKNDTQIADQTNMVFASTLVISGRAKVVITKTAMETEVGKIASMLDNVGEMTTPLQDKLNKLSKTLGVFAIILCVVIFVIGLLEKKDALDMLMTSISLAVAVIPESLVTISTIVLAIGVQKMAKNNAIIKNLPSVETLGSATYICSDKTGTLTQNKMTVTQVYYDYKVFDILNLDKKADNKNIAKEESKIVDDSLNMLVNSLYLCNDTNIDKNGNLNGDPTEVALFEMAYTLGYLAKDFKKKKRIFDIPFDSTRKLMTTVNIIDDNILVFVKGGIDEILNITNGVYLNGNIVDDKKEIEKYISSVKKENQEMASKSLRVLACGFKKINLPNNIDKSDIKAIKKYIENIKQDLEKDISLIGIVGMIDPPRQEVKSAIEETKTAGIKTVMITGDHKSTAISIAKELGILDDEKQALSGTELDKMSDKDLEKNVKNYTVYSRVNPEHKLRIVDALQKNNEIVAMTRDGVNDSPALKKANIGCSMGKIGTDVAKEASDVILSDDNFSTIVKAVKEGRRIYDNILKAIEFLLSSNIGETVCILLGTLFLPLISSCFGIDISKVSILIPIQILLINLVTDSFPALGFAFMHADDDIMNRKPNKKSGIFTKGFTWRVIYQGIMIGVLTFVSFVIGLGSNDIIEGLTPQMSKIEIGQTMAFLTLAFGELIHSFNVINSQKSIFKSKVMKNKEFILSILASSMIMVAIIFIPFLRNLFRIVLLPPKMLMIQFVILILPIIIVEIMKLFKLNGKRI